MRTDKRVAAVIVLTSLPIVLYFMTGETEDAPRWKALVATPNQQLSQAEMPTNGNVSQQLSQPEMIIAPGSDKDDKYEYPDTDSQLVCFLTWFESRVDGALDPEYAFWLRAQAYIEKKSNMALCNRVRSFLPGQSQGVYLDVGCGLGRVVAKYGSLFESTHCLEADGHRIGEAKQMLERDFPGWINRVQFHNTRFLDWQPPDGIRVDAITCVHVIQHIPTHEVSSWLRKMHTILNDGGVLVLATTISLDNSFYRLGSAQKVDEDVFNHHADTSRAKEGNVHDAIAVHFYSQRSLKDLLYQNSFEVLEAGAFMFHVESGLPESQYAIACRREDYAHMDKCQPYKHHQSPSTSAIELASLSKLTFLKENYRKYCSDSHNMAVNLEQEMEREEAKRQFQQERYKRQMEHLPKRHGSDRAVVRLNEAWSMLKEKMEQPVGGPDAKCAFSLQSCSTD